MQIFVLLGHVLGCLDHIFGCPDNNLHLKTHSTKYFGLPCSSCTHSWHAECSHQNVRTRDIICRFVSTEIFVCVAPIEVGCGTECLPSFFPPFFYFREQLNECRLTTQERTYPANMLFGKYRRYFYSRRGNSCQAAALQDKYGPLPWSHSLTCHHHYVRTTLLYCRRRIFNWDLTEYNLNQRKSLAD